LFSCIQAPLEDLRQWIRPGSAMDKHSMSGSHGESEEAGCNEDLLHSSPTRAPAVSGPSGLSYIDSDGSSDTSDAEDEEVLEARGSRKWQITFWIALFLMLMKPRLVDQSRKLVQSKSFLFFFLYLLIFCI
jgi:hypothetical protein